MDAQTLLAFEPFRDFRGQPFRSLCYAPFVQLSFTPDGNVFACVESRSHPLGNLCERRLDELWQCERARRMQQELRSLRFPRACSTCAWRLAAHRFRRHAIRQFDHLPVDPEKRWPGRLEFALANTCNLGCIMCNPDLSSVLRARADLPALPRPYDDRFFADLAPYLEHARELSFLGGEPFLQKECFRIWDMLIERGLAPPCHVTTNGTIWNEQVEQVLAELPFDIAISIDGASPATFEAIRQNARWDEVLENLGRFESYVRGSGDRWAGRRSPALQLNYSLLLQNWHELVDFFRFAEDRRASVVVQLVVAPRHCSLFSLPTGELRALLAALEERGAALLPQLSPRNQEEWLELIEELGEHARAQREDAATGAGAEPPEAAPEAREPAGADAAPLERLESPPAAAAQEPCSSPASGGSTGSLQHAWFCMAVGEEAAALQAALRTPRHDPRYYDALVLVATVWGARRRHARAGRIFEQALRLDASRPEAYIARAWLRYQEGQIAEGLADLERAEGLMGPLERLNRMLVDSLLVTGAILLHGRGERRRALARLDRYRALEPDASDRQQSLRTLRPFLGREGEDRHAREVFRIAAAGGAPGPRH